MFYTWTVRLVADVVSLFSATEKIAWLATDTPQEGGAVLPAGAPAMDDDSDSDDENPKPKAVVVSGKGKEVDASWPRSGGLVQQRQCSGCECISLMAHCHVRILAHVND